MPWSDAERRGRYQNDKATAVAIRASETMSQNAPMTPTRPKLIRLMFGEDIIGCNPHARRTAAESRLPWT